MKRVKQVVTFDRNWLSKVEPGVPFTLVRDQEDAVSKPRVAERRMKSEITNRSLKNLGELLTIREAATILKVTERAVYDWVYQGKLRPIHVGRLIRISISDLEEFISA